MSYPTLRWPLAMLMMLLCVSCQPASKKETPDREPRVLASGEMSPQTPEQDFMGTRQAAERGDPVAQYQLAGFYMTGYGVDQNMDVAYQWTLKAAENGHTDAQFEVAMILIDSVHTDDQQKARRWFEACAMAYHKRSNAGDTEAQRRLSWMYETGNGVMQNTEQAELWAVEAFRREYEAGKTLDTEDLYNLGVAYFQGDVIEKDFVKAGEIFTKTAEAGLAQAQYSLALFYANGTAFARDEEKAFYWFTKASEQGHDKAQFEAAQRYYYGYGAPQRDLTKAFEIFQLSANQGNTKSQLMLGMMYGKGEAPGGKDYAQAAKWLEMTKDDKEFPIGKAFLGMMYLRGDGVLQDQKKGLQYLEEAAALGDETALNALQEWYNIQKRD